MGKWQQQFSIGYFVITLILLFALQTYFAAPRIGTITYSQFKTLVKKGLVSNVVIGEKVIRGDSKTEGLKEVLSPERLKELNEKDKEAKTPLPFTVVRVDDPELTRDLEQAGGQFKGEVTDEWVATLLSWVVPAVLFFLLWSYLFKRMGSGGGLMQIGKSKAKVYIDKQPMLPSRMSKASMRRRKNWSRWWSFSRTRKNIRDSAVEFRRGCCWSRLRARVRRCWLALWLAKRGYLFSAFPGLTSSRCLLG